ncbi:MAG: hypothetical protein WCA38_11545 [Candidatus Acidiferrales bacterium]
MNHTFRFYLKKRTVFIMFVAAAHLAGFSAVSLFAQNDMQQKLGELKESMVKNKQALAQYTWQETVVISLKGQQKKTQKYQVRMGSDGKPQKTSLDAAPQAQQDAGGRGGRLKQRVIERKKEEYEDYAEQMKALAQQYIPPDKDAIQAAYAKGNISFTPSAGAPDEVKIVIQNYLKPSDSMTIFFNKEQKQISAIRIASYMDDPSDGMNLSVKFSSLPDGVSHVSSASIDGVKKQLVVATQNSNYQKL